MAVSTVAGGLAATGGELSRVRPRQGFLTPAYPAERYVVFGSGDEAGDHG